SALAGPDDWTELTARAYDRNDMFRGLENRGLLPWEEEVFAEFLPEPPATLVVGAAGAGREMIELAASGYRVSGFEPAVGLAAVARREARCCVEIASYEQIFEAPPASMSGGFDAGILGWGSLSHLASPKQARRAVLAVRRLVPRGNLILSWVDDRPGELELSQRRVLTRMGLPTLDERSGYTLHGGFSRTYSMDEIFRLAVRTGHRVIRYQEGQYPHAVFALR
ncbi:MAG: hypothetical protein KJO07_22215, partial [Deltaproteobacteria bacterium]|nr:hypothetical protein [Deltaproteobacteria bacterium]